MIFEVECDTTKNEGLTDRTEHTMIVPFIVLDVYNIQTFVALLFGLYSSESIPIRPPTLLSGKCEKN